MHLNIGWCVGKTRRDRDARDYAIIGSLSGDHASFEQNEYTNFQLSLNLNENLYYRVLLLNCTTQTCL